MMNKSYYKKLFEDTSIYDLAAMATDIKREFHPENTITFVVDRNINYTNVCNCKCTFCSFYEDKGYVLSYQQIRAKTQELVDEDGTQILLQGGLNNSLSLHYYTNMLSALKTDFPSVNIHAFSPPEIDFFAQKFNKSPEDILKLFIKCGLSSIPGGGAEILVDKVRSELSPNKISSQRWLEIMEIAHSLGLNTTATMVFGSIETIDDIIEHLLKIKRLQNKTNGFRAFIPWVFQGGNKRITALDYLKIIALSRIILDNIPNIQASWVTQGVDIAQISLGFGVNDFGGTMMEENVVSSAGCVFHTTKKEIIHAIKKAGYIPAQRNTAYEILKIYE